MEKFKCDHPKAEDCPFNTFFGCGYGGGDECYFDDCSKD